MPVTKFIFQHVYNTCNKFNKQIRQTSKLPFKDKKAVFCETQWPWPPLFSPRWPIQWIVGWGSYIILFSPSDVTAFHRMKYGGGVLYNLVFTEWRHCVSQNMLVSQVSSYCNKGTMQDSHRLCWMWLRSYYLNSFTMVIEITLAHVNRSFGLNNCCPMYRCSYLELYTSHMSHRETIPAFYSQRHTVREYLALSRLASSYFK